MDISHKSYASRPWMNKYGAAGTNIQLDGCNEGLKGGFAGGIAGGIAAWVAYPSECIKTIMQLDETRGTKRFKGTIDCLEKTVKERGVLGLYRGFNIVLYGTVPKTGVRFGTFETLKRSSLDVEGELSNTNRFLCGFLAGIAEAIFVVIPVETIKTKLIFDHKKDPKKGLFSIVRSIIYNEGFRGIYRGASSTIVRQASNNSIRFFIMDYLNEAYRAGDPNTRIPFLATGAFGVIAAFASVYGNAPVDLLKTRMQMRNTNLKEYNSTWECAVDVWKQEGIKGFYKGSAARFFRSCVEVPLTFIFYDAIMEVLAPL
ncbi:unnamed protein product [Allacma fusca]|uniref:Citrate transport protein n=1 Tax=Allacma fusca TaxID=39272 RepID=A0A8J2LN33_9HEXA|nr:unnamed protein product [Allacma fusca]